MVLWSVVFLMVNIYFLKDCVEDWFKEKSFWKGFWVVIFVHGVALAVKDIYLGKAPDIILMFIS